jgi:hypothetical protein
MKRTMKKPKWILITFTGILALAIVVLSGAFKRGSEEKIYRSPETVSFSPDDRYVAVNDNTLNTLYLVSVEDGEVEEEIALEGKAEDLVWIDNQQLLVSEYETGKLLNINIEKGEIDREYEIGPKPFHMAVSGNELWIGQYGLNQVRVMDLTSGDITHSVELNSLPWDIQMVPGRELVLVAKQIPGYSAKGEKSATSVVLIDQEKKQKIKEIFLPHGSSNMRNLEVTPDGRWAYTVHTRGKTAIPTSQLENGWVNTNMLSIIDLEDQEWYTSVILDQLKEGAANPWDVVHNEKDGSLLISLEGVNELARVSGDQLHEYLDGGEMPGNLMKNQAKAYTAYNVWEEIKNDPSKRTMLKEQISALYAAELVRREKLPVQAPRGMDLSGDGNILAIAGQYSGNILLKNLEEDNIKEVSLGEQSEPGEVRKGEIWFHDATTTMESWLSCATCHPAGRNDGLNWDLLNDGIGNPKNTKSLVLSPETPPAMWSGVRSRAEIAVRAGFHFINFFEATDSKMQAVHTYLASLTPEKSPYAILQESDRSFRESVERGESLFRERGCIECHQPPLYTDQKTYEFEVSDERGINKFDVPTLKEEWRRGPYWHDGRKATLRGVLEDPDLSPCGGSAGELDDQDLEDLKNFMLTL